MNFPSTFPSLSQGIMAKDEALNQKSCYYQVPVQFLKPIRKLPIGPVSLREAYDNPHKKNLQLIFEPGKYIVSEAGYFLVKTNVVKQTTSTVFAAIDSGFNHLIRPMFYDAYHRIENISNADANPKIYSVVGYLCETDTFAWNRKIAEVRAGDILCFSNAGAYGFSMSSNYNSRFKPAEVMYLNNEFHLIKSRETMDDILRNQIMI